MAEDTQRPSRRTFAFDVQAPAQRPLEGGPQYNPGRLVGGNVTAGDQSPAGRNPTDFTPVLGSFIDGILKPHAERKAKQNFIKGMTDQMYTEAGEEIRTGNGVLSKIFGPTAYEEGAIFYEARERASKAQAEWAADEDMLKKLPREEVAKAWAQKLESVKTGDPYTDAAIENSMLEASGPMLQSVAKASYAYAQERATKAQYGAALSAADAHEAIMGNVTANSAADSPEVAAAIASANNLAAGLQPVAGQDEDAWKKNTVAIYEAMIQKGQGHAASILKERGILDMLDTDERRKLEDEYQKYGKVAIHERALADPAILAKIDDFEALRANGQITSTGAVEMAREINAMAKRVTGFDVDFLDHSEQTTALRGVWAMQAAADRRDEERGYQAERDDQRAARAEALPQLQAQADAALGVAAYKAANPNAAVVEGNVKDNAIQAAIYQGLNQGDFAGVAKNARFGQVSTAAKDELQGLVKSSVYSGYNPAFDNVYNKFTGLMQADPAAAKEYFGDTYAPMINYQRLLTSAPKDIAFTLAFADDIQYNASGTDVSKANSKIVKSVTETVQPGAFSRWFAGEVPLNASGVRELAAVADRNMAIDGKFGGGGLSDVTQLKTGIAQARANGNFEKAGALGWSNRPGTKPLWQALGMQQGEGSTVVEATVDVMLKRAGFTAGAKADEYRIERGKANGEDILTVIPVEDNVLSIKHAVTIGMPIFRAAADAWRKRLSGEDTYRPSKDVGAIRAGALQQPGKPTKAQEAANEAERLRRLYRVP